MDDSKRRRGKRTRAFEAVILVPALCFATSASAEIFTCVTRSGGPLFQNFPCQFDSIGSVASAAMPTNAVVNPDDEAEPRVGMTTDQIRKILGEPREIVAEEDSDGIQTWRYVDRSVQADRAGRVVAVLMW